MSRASKTSTRWRSQNRSRDVDRFSEPVMDELKGALIRRRALIAAAPGNEEPSSSRAHRRTSPSDLTTTSRTTSRDGAANPGRPLRRRRGASLYRIAPSPRLFQATMHELTTPKEMRAWSRAERARGQRLGFVPTMGALHEGHLRLVDRAKERTDRVVLSIFVNPLQFGPKEDFAKYPRDMARDRSLAAERGVDCLFVPALEAVYPQEPLVRIASGPMADTLEGAARSGHFSGVLTVVAKLFHMVEPDVAVFGRKDFQQAMLVRRMAADLDFGLEVDIAPTVRELDGLALSSRNSYLDADQRRAALALSRALRAVEQAWRSGEADPKALQRRGMQALMAPGVALMAPGVSPGYLELVDEQLRPVARVDARTVVVIAAQVGATRLIDNVVLGEGVGSDIAVRV